MFSSARSYRRRRRRQQRDDINGYCNKLPILSGSSTSSLSSSSNFELLSSHDSSTEISTTSGNSDSDSTSENQQSFDPSKKEYLNLIYTTFLSHGGLNLRSASLVVNLFNYFMERYYNNVDLLPNFRSQWNKKSKKIDVGIYVLCGRNHSHGPFRGEPKHYQPYSCDGELFQPKIEAGKYFFHLPLSLQLSKILPTIPDSYWIPDDFYYPDISTCYQAKKVKRNIKELGHQKLTLCLHADEISTFSSSKEKLFPIFVTVNEMKIEYRRKYFMLVALFVGHKKPDVGIYLGPIVEELRVLSRTPLEWNTPSNQMRKATFHLISLIADAPMRSYLRSVKQFNHTYGCDWCLIQATSVSMARLYPNQTRNEARLLQRSKQDFLDFRNMLNQNQGIVLDSINPRFAGMNGVSPLLDLEDFDIVQGVAVEPMHCISLGVFRNLIMKGFLGNSAVNLFQRNIDRNNFKCELSNRLTSISVTTEFTRAPRCFDDLKYWKSSEFDSFLSYFLLTTIKGLLKPAVINHLLTLSRIYYIAHIGSGSVSVQNELDNLVEEFQTGCAVFYGPKFLSYNLHIMTHLADSYKNLGPNSSASSYPLEDQMGDLKKKVHRFSNIGQSLIRYFINDFRYKEYKTTIANSWDFTCEEKSVFGFTDSRDIHTKIVDKNPILMFNQQELLDSIIGDQINHETNLEFIFLKSVKYQGIRYSTAKYSSEHRRDDSKIKSKDGRFMCIVYICEYGSDKYLLCHEYSTKPVNVSFKGFTGSFSYTLSNLHEIHSTSKDLHLIKFNDIGSKFIFVKSTNFHYTYKHDFAVDQFLRNR